MGKKDKKGPKKDRNMRVHEAPRGSTKALKALALCEALKAWRLHEASLSPKPGNYVPRTTLDFIRLLILI